MHVPAQVASSSHCGSLATFRVALHDWGHGKVWAASAEARPPAAQEQDRENTCVGRWHAFTDQKWEDQGESFLRSLLSVSSPAILINHLGSILDLALSSQVCRGIKDVRCHSVEFVDGKEENFDAIILATGYKSNVPSWLKVANQLFYLRLESFP